MPSVKLTGEWQATANVAERQIVARRFRWWQKKRGARRTGSKLLGSLGEALFFAVLLVFGTVALTALVVSQVVSPVPSLAAAEASGDSPTDSPTDSTTARAGGHEAADSTAAANAPARAIDEGNRLMQVVASYRYGFGFWLMTLVLASFVIMGGSGLAYTILRLGTSAERIAALAKRAADIDLISEAIPSDKAFPTLPSDSDLTNSPGIRLAYRLPTTESPAWQLTAATVFGLLWNGLAIGLFVVAVNSHVHGNPDWLLTLLVVPFVAVGAWSVRYLFRQLLLVTAIGPTILEIADHRLRPGSRCQVYFAQTGHRRLKRITVELVCEEEVHYHQGTDIRTEVAIVNRREVFHRDDPGVEVGEPFECEAELNVPAEAMHSFQSTFSRVRWKLVVRAEVEGFPVQERSFPVIVYPPVARCELEPRRRADASESVRPARV